MKNHYLYISRKITIKNGKRSSLALNIAIASVALSLIIMLFSIAIIKGFKTEITQRVLGFNPHITIYPMQVSDSREQNIFTLSSQLENLLNEEPYIIDFGITTSIPAILKTDKEFQGVYIKGVSEGSNLDFINSCLLEGSSFDCKNNDVNSILISEKLANRLGINVGDKIEGYFVNPEIRVRKVEIKGIFCTHFEDYDDIYIYGNIGMIQNLCGLDTTQGTSIEITTDNFENIDLYSNQLYNKLVNAVDAGIIPHFQLSNALHQGAVYFGWLALLDANVIVILALMIILACFTLISGMLIIILEKVKFIGVMKSLGASNKLIRKIFVIIMLRIAIIGIGIGNIIAILLLYIQNKFHILSLDPQSYYIDFVPVEFDWLSILILNISVISVIYLMLILPSHFIAKISPIQTMRQE